MRTFDRHLIVRFAMYVVFAELVMSQLVILVNTVIVLRPILEGALPMTVFWDAYLGSLPNVLYLTLPLAAAFVLTFGYAQLARDSALTVLAGAGISNWRIAMPGLIVAVATATSAALIAHLWAPSGAERLEQAKSYVRSEFPHRLLPAGEYIDVMPSRVTIYFKAWVDDDVVSAPFLLRREGQGKSVVIEARYARFERKGRRMALLFLNGHISNFDRRDGSVQLVRFKKYLVRMPLPAVRGAGQRRPEAYERSTAWLLSPPPAARRDTARFQRFGEHAD